MQLIDLGNNKSLFEFQNKSVILLRIKKYSPLILRYFIKYIAKLKSLDIQKIDLEIDFLENQNKLQTTFLGQSFLYWFSDISLINSKKKRSDWLEYISSYQGPHVLVGCITDDITYESSAIIVEVQDYYTSEQVVKLNLLYEHNKIEHIAYFIGKLYRYRKQYSAEQLCMLIEYAGVLGKNTDVFLDSWLDHLITSDVSLYVISQLFFAKKPDEFFETWHLVRSLYSEQFWTSFFSEQIFKAYWFVCWQGKIIPEYKSIVFGLPFSFLKQDWKMYQSSFLQKSHQMIYSVDIALKSGSDTARLDLFLIQFFQGF